jgi:8-oxo-dGTP pyrophosphatase MutT (NUDIX family)
MTKISHDSEVLAVGQQVITACAFIHRQIDGVDKVFLPKRAATKKFLPDVYELPGGHIDYGEDIVVGLKREIEEEFGVTVNVGDPFAVFTYTNDIKGSHSIEVIYFARLIDDPDAITLNPEDHSEAGWFAENELSKVTTQNKDIDDIEFVSIKKGFALLRGERPSF